MTNAAEAIQQPYAGELAQLTDAEELLGKLRQKYAEVPDGSTKEGYKTLKAGIRELTSLRTGTDKGRLAITAPHREFIDRVNKRAKALIGEVEVIEKPLRDAKAEVDEAAEREKQARIAKLRERLESELAAYRDTSAGLDGPALAQLAESAEGMDVSGYFDITAEAEEAKEVLIQELRQKRDDAFERERIMQQERELEAERARLREAEEKIEAERAELAKLRAEQAKADARLQERLHPEPLLENQIMSEALAEYHQPIDTSRIAAAADGYAPPVPASDVADVEDLIDARQEAITNWDEAFEDLCDFGLDIDDAQALLAEIAAGGIRHVAFSQGDA